MSQLPFVLFVIIIAGITLPIFLIERVVWNGFQLTLRCNIRDEGINPFEKGVSLARAGAGEGNEKAMTMIFERFGSIIDPVKFIKIRHKSTLPIF